MPRHPVGARSAQKTSDAPAAPLAMPGGAAGMPDPGGEMPMAAHNPYADTQSMAGRPYVEAKKWMITDGPRSADNKIRFNSDGYMVLLAPGKIVTEATHSLDKMRAQGITLEEMPEIREVPVDEPEAPLAMGTEAVA